MDGKTNTLAVLWENVCALMEWYLGGEALGRFASEVGIGAASMTRIKKQDTAVGVDVLEKIATRFRLQPWQLLAPRLGAELHVLGTDMRLSAVPAFHVDIAQELRSAPTVASAMPGRPGGVQWTRTKQGTERERTEARPARRRRGS